MTKQNKVIKISWIVAAALSVPALITMFGCAPEGVVDYDDPDTMEETETGLEEEPDLPQEEEACNFMTGECVPVVPVNLNNPLGITCYEEYPLCYAEFHSNQLDRVYNICDLVKITDEGYVRVEDGWYKGCHAGFHPQSFFVTTTVCFGKYDNNGLRIDTLCYNEFQTDWWVEIHPNCDIQKQNPVPLWGTYPQWCDHSLAPGAPWLATECQGASCIALMTNDYGIYIQPDCTTGEETPVALDDWC